MTDAMVLEARDQARVLQNGRDRAGELEAVRRRGYRRLWLAGCGDMHMAAEAAAVVGECVFGQRVRALSSMDLRWWRDALTPEDLLVAASVSGRTPRTVEALRIAREVGTATLAITDDPGSPLAEAATDVAVLNTAPPEALHQHEYQGYSSEVPQTRTYMAVLQWFLTLAQPLDQSPWDGDLAQHLQRCQEPFFDHARELARTMASVPVKDVIVLGSGPFAPIASYGAAKLLEYAIPARACCLEEFHHLDLFTVGEGTWLSAVQPDAASAQRFTEVRGVHDELGARTVEWSSDPGPLPSLSLPTSLFTTALAMQWQAYHLARELGRDVNRWVGGVRRDQIFRLSQRTIRDSSIRTDLGS